MDPNLAEQVQVRLDRELARRVQHGGWLYPPFVLAFAMQSSLGRERPGVCGIFAALLLVAAALRSWLAGRVLQAPEISVRLWADRLSQLILALLVVWTGFMSLAFWYEQGNLLQECVLVVCMAGFTSIGASLMVPRPHLAWAQLWLQAIPIWGWVIVAIPRLGWILIFMIACYHVVAVMMLRAHGRYCQENFETQVMLEMHGEKLRLAMEKAEEASAARSRFLANVSHEIRTPLNGVIGLTEAVSDTVLSEDQRTLIDAARRSGEHLRAIVDDILDFSKITAGAMQIQPQPCDLQLLIREVSRPFEALAAAKEIGWSVEIDTGVPPWVRADPVRLRQVLANLLSNAVKFTARGQVRLIVEDLPGPGRVLFRVCDSGSGIEPEQAAQLFQEFAQANHSKGGTGLGLVISRRLVELMGGELHLASQPGAGSEFSFWLPLEVAAAPAAGKLDRVDKLPIFPPSFKILVAEDNAVNRLVISRLLQPTGAQIEFAENGRLAVARQQTVGYNLILMDLNMPELDGIEATKAIRQLAGALAEVPIVALTANAFAEDRERCLIAGMNAHVAKPVRREELAQALTDLRLPE